MGPLGVVKVDCRAPFGHLATWLEGLLHRDSPCLITVRIFPRKQCFVCRFTFSQRSNFHLRRATESFFLHGIQRLLGIHSVICRIARLVVGIATEGLPSRVLLLQRGRRGLWLL